MILVFIYVPIALIVVYSFNSGTTPAWPPVGLHARLVVGGDRATPACSRPS